MALHGRTLAITRPIAQAGTLAERIRQAGGTPLLLPLLNIIGTPNTVLAHPAAQDLSPYRLAIFISPNAVLHSLPLLLDQQPWPTDLQAAAVGPGTADALARFGIPCLLPEGQFDSEGLLQCAPLQSAVLRGQRVLLVKGNGGRELLAQALTERGALVEPLSVYHRAPPTDVAEPLRTAWRTTGLDAILLTASEGLHPLLDALSPLEQQQLRQTPLFAPHPRIAESARAAGFAQVILTPPAEPGLLAGLLAYNWAH